MNKIYYDRPSHSQNRNTPDKKSLLNKLQDNLKQPEKGLKDMIANGILIVLSIGLAVNILVVLNSVYENGKTWTRSEKDIWYSISYGNYRYLIDDMWENRFSGAKETEGLKQCYAVAEYLEAAMLYKASDYTDKTEKKEKYENIMKEKLAYFDDILYIAEDINEQLGIEDFELR